MNLWTISLILAYAFVIILNLIFSFSLGTVLNIFICLAIIMLPAALFLYVGRLLPHSLFTEEKFKVSNFRQKICDVTNVKSWKDSIPVCAKVEGGGKIDKLTNPKSVDYLNGYIYASCFAEWLHFTICVWSIVAIFVIALINKQIVLTLALPLSLIFVYQNITSTIIQWYMRPRIVKLRDRLVEKTQYSSNEDEERVAI